MAPSIVQTGAAASANRENSIVRAEQLLKQGRLDAAIAIYAQLVTEQPQDWMLANTLGDAHARAGDLQSAIAAYMRVAEHLVEEGSLPKAAALYKKVLKLAPEDDSAELRLAEISAKQRLFADARSHLSAVASRRRARGDQAGALAVLRRFESIDPSDFDARMTALQRRIDAGHPCDVAELREVVAELTLRGRGAEALVLLWPAASSDPMLLVTLAELELRAGRPDEGRTVLERVMASDPDFATRIEEVGLPLIERDAVGAFVCFDVVADTFARAEQWTAAADIIQRFLAEAPWHVPAALKLVEICIDGGLEGTMYEAQSSLADACLASGRGVEASMIAQDLLAQAPGDAAHLERLQRATSLLRDQAEVGASTDSPYSRSSSGGPAEGGSTSASVSAAVEKPKVAVTGHEIDLSKALDLTELMRPADAIELPDVSAGEAGLDEAFRAFRDEICRDSSDEAAEQQYKLGLAYHEMSMLEESVEALELAARSSLRRFEAASLLGRIYRDMGLLGEAVEWMERAAETPPPAAEDGRLLLYDLGGVLEQLGEGDRSLAVLLELQAEAGTYRDIASRIDRLLRLQTGV